MEGMLSGKSIIIDGDSLPIKELIAYLFGCLMSELYSDWKRYGFGMLSISASLLVWWRREKKEKTSRFSIGI